MKQNNAYKRSLLVLALSFFAVTGALAQFSVGAEVAIPMGTPWSDGVNTGFGGSLSYQAPINDNLSWTGYFGYQSYGTKFGGYAISIIPIQAGVKYYFTESGNGFYGEFDLGVFIASSNVPNSTSESKFGFTPAIGYRVSSFDLGLRYNLISDANNLAFRVAYVFGSN